MAPVHGEQPSERMRHITSCGFSPGRSGTNGCSTGISDVAAHDDLARLREVQRHDGDVLFVDVLPDVDFGPVRERKHADALARPDAAVEQVPELGPLALRVPLALLVAQREDALLGARPFLVAPRAAERGIEVAGLERVEQRPRLQQAAAPLRADGKRLRAGRNRVGVRVDDQPRADFASRSDRGTRSSP